MSFTRDFSRDRFKRERERERPLRPTKSSFAIVIRMHRMLAYSITSLGACDPISCTRRQSPHNDIYLAFVIFFFPESRFTKLYLAFHFGLPFLVLFQVIACPRITSTAVCWLVVMFPRIYKIKNLKTKIYEQREWPIDSDRVWYAIVSNTTIEFRDQLASREQVHNKQSFKSLFTFKSHIYILTVSN